MVDDLEGLFKRFAYYRIKDSIAITSIFINNIIIRSYIISKYASYVTIECLGIEISGWVFIGLGSD